MKIEEGTIPTGWANDLLDEIAERGSGHTPNKNVPEYWHGGIKWISLKDSNKLDRIYISETEKEISQEGIKNSSAVLYPAGVVVISRDAGVGKSAITTQDMAVSQHFIIWKCGPKLNNHYLYYWLQLVKPEFERVAAGSTIKTIGLPYFKKLHITYPTSMKEQLKIVEIVMNWDRTIDLTQQIIAAKQQYKHGMMQQLLTGKQRFREFADRVWIKKRLGDLFLERHETGRSDLPLLSITSKEGIVPRDSVERRDTSNEDKSAYLRICKEDIGYNTMRMWQGVSAVSSMEGIVSPAYTVCVPFVECVDVNFMGYLFKFPPMIHLFFRYSQGLVDDTLTLKFDAFSNIEVTIPPLDEQKRIAEVLAMCDRELDLLNRKIALLKKQKQGLMQQLLTGKVRVKA
jgi:type I restriction enzyme, S subunit